MAKRKSNDGTSTSKMTVMVFQLEGDDATLQEGFRTISNAISRVMPTTGLQASLPAQHAPSGLPAPESPDDSDVDYIDAEPVVTSSSNGTNGSRKRSVKSPQVLDLDFTSGEVPLKSFLTKFAGDQVTKRYLLIAYWFKHYGELEDVTMDHIHTGYRHMGWQTPKDASQPLRDMKSKQGWFHKGDGRGSYKINHIGENEVMNIMKEDE